MASEEFKKIIKNFLEVSEKLTESKKNINAMTHEKTALSKIIIEYMIENNIDACNLADGVLSLKKTETTEKVTYDKVKSVLSTYVTSADVNEESFPEDAAKTIIESLDKKLSYSLKVTKNKN